MIHKSDFLCLCLWFACGVFGVDGDEVKSVSVMEGGSVTLHTHLTRIQKDNQILWMFIPHGTLIAELNEQANSSPMYVNDERFKDKLQMDSLTGSLTITNISRKNAGPYKLRINSRTTSYSMRFNVTVNAHLSVPVIIKISSQCSSSSERSSVSKCVLLCSVMNVTHVSLSWYKGNSLLSSISVSDLNIRLSLPLEVEYHDTNTYRCVINNLITIHTQHLDMNDVCQKCSDALPLYLIVLIAVAVISLVVISVIQFWGCKKKRKTATEVQTLEEEILYSQPNVFARTLNNTNVVEADHTEYSSVVT